MYENKLSNVSSSSEESVTGEDRCGAHLRCDVVGRADRAVGQGAPVLLPRLGTALAVHRVGRRKVGRLGLTQVPVEIGPVRLLQTRAQTKVGQLRKVQSKGNKISIKVQ